MKICSYEGCNKGQAKNEFCLKHQNNESKPERLCSVENCDRKHYSKNMCRMHYARKIRTGNTELKSRNKDWTLNNHGYLYRIESGHIAANKVGLIYQHREVMSEILGRPLTNHETVHHKNGVRSDNRPENLELRTSHHGCGQSVRDMIVFCKNYLAIYDKPEIFFCDHIIPL